MKFPALELSTIVAIVCAVALFGAWTLGMASRPERGASAGQPLNPVQAFAPPPGFVGSHIYGLWTLTCTPPAQTVAPVGTDNPRCRTQGLINARRSDKKVVSLVAIRVLRAGPQNAPYLVIYLPLRAKGDGTMLFAVDGNKAFRAPIKECTATTCKVEAPLPPDALDQMLAGVTLKLQFGAAAGAALGTFSYPLHGFRESFEALTASELPA